MILLQVPWCCKLRKGGIYTIANVSLLNSIILFYVGGWMVKQRGETSGKDFYCPAIDHYSTVTVTVTVTAMVTEAMGGLFLFKTSARTM